MNKICPKINEGTSIHFKTHTAPNSKQNCLLNLLYYNENTCLQSILHCAWFFSIQKKSTSSNAFISQKPMRNVSRKCYGTLKKNQETHAVVNLPLCYKRIHYGIQQAIKRKQFLQSYAPSNQLYNLLLFWIFVHIRIIVMKFQNKSSLVSQNWMLCHVHYTICIMSKWHRPKRTDVILWILEHRYCSKPWVHWLDFSIVTLSNLKYT